MPRDHLGALLRIVGGEEDGDSTSASGTSSCRNWRMPGESGIRSAARTASP